MYCLGEALSGYPIGIGSLLNQIPSICDVESVMQNDVDYLLIAKPVAINHLGIRRD